MAASIIRAEMAGTVISVTARTGDMIGAEETILIMESMKMEMPVTTPAAGTIAEIFVAEDDVVTEGQPLARMI